MGGGARILASLVLRLMTRCHSQGQAPFAPQLVLPAACVNATGPAPQVSRECQDCISQLLFRNPARRLGSNGGAEEIKSHPFFKDVNWALLRHQAPPFIPRSGMSTTPWHGSAQQQQQGRQQGR